jgi:hypothetical protein
MQEHNGYEFYIIVIKGRYTFLILDNIIEDKVKFLSDELFDYAGRAQLAVIGQIELFEKQEKERLHA